MNLKNCKLIDRPKITDPESNLTPIEGGRRVPFEIKRVFYLYDVPGGATRAGHALKSCQQLIIAMSESFDVKLDDGTNTKYHLNRSYRLACSGSNLARARKFSSGSV